MAAKVTLIGTKGTSVGGASNVSTGTGRSFGGPGSVFDFWVEFDPGVTPSGVPTDTFGNTFALVGSVNTGRGKLANYQCIAGVGGLNHNASISFSGSAFASAYLTESTVVAGAPADIVTSGAVADPGPYSIASGTLAQADEVVIAMGEINLTGGTNAYTVTGWTILAQESDGGNYWTSALAAKQVSSTASVTATFAKGGESANTAGLLLRSYKGATGPVLGGHNYAVDFLSAGGSSISTGAFDSSGGGIILACVGRGIIADHATAVVDDNKGNGTYTQLGTSHAYSLWLSSGTALFAKTGAAGGAGHTVNVTKPTPSDEVTVFAAEFLNVDTIVDVQWLEDTSGPVNTGPTVTFGAAGIMCAFWWGDDAFGNDYFSALSAGWTALDFTTSLASNHVQGACAFKPVSAAGTYGIDWTPHTSQGAQMWLIAMQSGGTPWAGAGVGNSTGSAGLTTERPMYVGEGMVGDGMLGAGNPPAGGAAALAGTGSNVATGSAALTNAIRLALAGQMQATGTAALTTGIPLAAAGLVVASGAAALTAAIRLALAGLTQSTGAADMATQILLAAAGQVTAVGTGAIATGIPLAGTGANVASGTADLSTSPGGFAAAGQAIATGSAAMATGIPLAGTGAAVSTGSGVITTAITLTAAGLAAALGNAALDSAIRLNAAGNVVAAGSAGLTSQILMAAVAQALSTGSGSLTVQIQLNGAGFVQATGTAGLTANGVGLSGAGAVVAGGSAAITTGIPLLGAGASAGTGSAALATAIRIAAAGQDVATGSASMATAIPLAAVGVVAGAGTGSLTANIRLTAAGLAQAIGTGGLTIAIQLAADGVATAAGAGLLSAAFELGYSRFHRAIEPARTLRVPESRRSFRAPHTARTFRAAP